MVSRNLLKYLISSANLVLLDCFGAKAIPLAIILNGHLSVGREILQLRSCLKLSQPCANDVFRAALD